MIGDATRAYFNHLSRRSARKLRLHLRRGGISLMIDLAFLGAIFSATQFLGEEPVSRMLRESLVIGGWVAMWRPMEVFL